MTTWQPDWAQKWAVYSPTKVAVKEYETGRSISYGELHQTSSQLAAYFQQIVGLQKGDRVAVIAEFCLEYIIAFSTAQKIGIILVPLNYRLAPAEVDYLINDAKPSLLLVEDKFQHLVPTTSIPVVRIEDLLSTIKAFPTESSFQPTAIEEEDPVFILYTSGTTGFPKGALYTHKMLFWNSINTSISLIVNTESRTLNVMPPFHTGGWNVLITPFLHHGGYICLLKKLDAAVALELLQSERCTLFMGVPTILQMMARTTQFETAQFPDMLYLIVGGEPMPLPLIEQWHQKKVPVRQGYGMTEVGPNLTSLHQDDAIRKKGSIGRPNFYVQIQLVDHEGKIQPPGGGPGELWLRGPMVMPGYWNNPSGTQTAFSEDGTWFKTGDELYQDEEGYLYVVDRIKNMYKSGGENIYPAEIERILLQLPHVLEAAVVGVPNEKWGEVGCAFIVDDPNNPVDLEAAKVYCSTKLAKFKVPYYFQRLDALPKTDSGKINRQLLKKWQP